MRIVLSGGGTAGHINPALALAEELQDRGHEVLFAGTPGGVEKTLVEMAGIPFKGFEVSGFDRSHPLTLVKGLKSFRIRLTKREDGLQKLNQMLQWCLEAMRVFLQAEQQRHFVFRLLFMNRILLWAWQTIIFQRMLLL